MLRSIVALLSLLVLAAIVFMVADWRYDIYETYLKQTPQEEEAEIIEEHSEEVYGIVALFVAHTILYGNEGVYPGEEAEWLTACTFVNAAKRPGEVGHVPFRTAFREALAFSPNDSYKPWFTEEAPHYSQKSVREQLEDDRHMVEMGRIREDVVKPLLDRGLSAVPELYLDLCDRVNRMFRPNWEWLEHRGWSERRLARDVPDAGWVELRRIGTPDPDDYDFVFFQAPEQY